MHIGATLHIIGATVLVYTGKAHSVYARWACFHVNSEGNALLKQFVQLEYLSTIRN